MSKTAAMINVETVVSRFLLKYKLSTDDAFIYTEHCCNAIRDFNLYDSDLPITEKVTVNANKWIDMPSDMIGFIDLVLPIGGAWWSFTEKREIVNTTTFTGLTEGRDSTFGEGVDMTQPRSLDYGAKGAVNDYYYTIDWSARRIFVNGIESDTVVLIYTTSGIEASGTTQVPEMITPMLDAYMLWKSSYWRQELARERQMLEKDFTNARLSIRNLINSMSYNQWRDVILGSATQSVQR